MSFYFSQTFLFYYIVVSLSIAFKNGNQITKTMKKSIICSKPPIQELVAKIPFAIIGTVQGTETPVGVGKIPEAMAK